MLVPACEPVTTDACSIESVWSDATHVGGLV